MMNDGSTQEQCHQHLDDGRSAESESKSATTKDKREQKVGGGRGRASEVGGALEAVIGEMAVIILI